MYIILDVVIGDFGDLIEEDVKKGQGTGVYPIQTRCAYILKFSSI